MANNEINEVLAELGKLGYTEQMRTDEAIYTYDSSTEATVVVVTKDASTEEGFENVYASILKDISRLRGIEGLNIRDKIITVMWEDNTKDIDGLVESLAYFRSIRRGDYLGVLRGVKGVEIDFVDQENQEDVGDYTLDAYSTFTAVSVTAYVKWLNSLKEGKYTVKYPDSLLEKALYLKYITGKATE